MIALLNFGERKVGAFSQSKCSRSETGGRAAAYINAHARIVRDSADGQGGIVAKPLAICANCSKSALKREKAFRVFAVVRVCEKARENAFASTLRRQGQKQEKKIG